MRMVPTILKAMAKQPLLIHCGKVGLIWSERQRMELRINTFLKHIFTLILCRGILILRENRGQNCIWTFCTA